ncbi:YigZ family protein [Sessilibacter corallicola]|uniref:YigZ family protein n=1 Tax=Sessilibacter corallicola TaxID=2904075 RepID=A0ABQ0A4E6_9GAMM
MNSYCIPTAEHCAEIEIKRSQFIAFANHAASREAAEAFIKDIRTRHPQARHVCWAYIAGPPNTTIRSMSDDGEPSGTAGRPMLAVIEHSEFSEIVVAVVRYFGGIKLGTGGLQRAYSDSVSAVLKDLPKAEFVAQSKIKINADFSNESLVRRLVDKYQATIENVEYLNRVNFEILVSEENEKKLLGDLVNQSGGAITVVNDM